MRSLVLQNSRILRQLDLQGFERGLFFSLSTDGWLISKKSGFGPYTWKLSRALQAFNLPSRVPEEQINLPQEPISVHKKQIGPPKVPIKSPEESGSCSISNKPQLLRPATLPFFNEDLISKQLSSRIMKALPEMLNDKDAYTAFSHDLTGIMLKHALLWIEKDKKKPPRQDGIPIELKGVSLLKCPCCESLNRKNSSFCSYCGNQLQDTSIEKIRKENHLGLK